MIVFICMFTYIMLPPSVRGKFKDDRNLTGMRLVHHHVPSVSHRVWQGVDPQVFKLSVWHFRKSVVLWEYGRGISVVFRKFSISKKNECTLV